MNLGLISLLERISDGPDEAMVLVTVTETIGSTYRKPGAMMLLDSANRLTGLISGGCLEADLMHHASRVRDSGEAKSITYDLRDDDPIWGLGLGCGGLVKLLLEPANPGNQFAGLSALTAPQTAGQTVVLCKVVDSEDPRQLGHWSIDVGSEHDTKPQHRLLAGGVKELRIPIHPPRHLLICGGGPDVPPLVTLATECQWRVSVVDHRPAYAKSEHFPGAQQVICAPVSDSLTAVSTAFDAAVIMSHHLPSDIDYARQLAATSVRYVGLLGPAERRSEVLAQANIETDSRFYGPAGLDIGADLPSTIALSILAEAHAALNGGLGGSLRDGATE